MELLLVLLHMDLAEVEEMLKGYDIYVSTSMGDASAEQIAGEMQIISVLVAIVVISVLLLTSETWAEVPVLLLTFCAAALITKGTNFMMGTISFVSNSVTIVLQLALSIDYAVIFCNRYKEEHQKLSVRQAPGIEQSHTRDFFQFADNGRRTNCHDVYAVWNRKRYGPLLNPRHRPKPFGRILANARIDYAFRKCNG